jgi:hypothetical protein
MTDDLMWCVLQLLLAMTAEAEMAHQRALLDNFLRTKLKVTTTAIDSQTGL